MNQPVFLRDVCQEFGGERIAVGIDAKDGLVAVKGWTETTSSRAVDLALSAQEAGAKTVIYTDIATDGMLEGPNYLCPDRALEPPRLQPHRQRRSVEFG